MTVYVGRGIADKPRVQHLRNTDEPDDVVAVCGLLVSSAAVHARRRRANFGWRKPLTPIRYDDLPMCKRCTRRQEGTHQ